MDNLVPAEGLLQGTNNVKTLRTDFPQDRTKKVPM